MSSDPALKQSDSAEGKSDSPMEQLDHLNQLTKALQSFVEQLAGLIVTKNWVSLLLLVDAVILLFFNPVVLNKFLSTFNFELPKHYPVFFWALILGVFLAALVNAIRTIQRKPPTQPDFTERKAIKGLRAFSREDADIFAKLQRERDLRECLESITSKTFRFGILMGESGAGKTSFLQAGIISQLNKSAKYQGIYIRFSNQEPIATIYQGIKEELATPSVAINKQDLIEILSWAVDTAEKPLILIFDQFEQFFVHYKQKVDREPLINALKSWYCGENPLPVKILISIREDLAGKLHELQQALGYSLNNFHNYFRLEKFSSQQASKILQVICQAENITFEDRFVQELTRDELASNEDGLISPVDLQVLAWTIERQDNQELQAFNRNAFQKIGGIEGLMTRFLNKTLDARVIPSQRQAAIKVLLAMTDLERNVRAGVLNLEDLQAKTQGTLSPGEIVEAATWLASGGVRLITPVTQDGNHDYELAHERIIPALREVAGKELTSADRANQLLDRRVNEWLGNQRSSRYLFNLPELRLFKQQQPYLVWGTNRSNKERLLQRSWRKLYQQLVAVAMVMVFALSGVVWWHTPWGQIQQVRWELASLSKQVGDEYKVKAALAFSKDEDFEQALAIINSIKYSEKKADTLIAIAETIGKLKNSPQSDKFLTQVITIAEKIDNSFDKARTLISFVDTYNKLENFNLASKYFEQAIIAVEHIGDPDNFYDLSSHLLSVIGSDKYIAKTSKGEILKKIISKTNQLSNKSEVSRYLRRTIIAIEQIDNVSDKVFLLTAIAESYFKLGNSVEARNYLGQVISTTEQIDDVSDKANVLQTIAKTIGKSENFTEAGKYLGLAITAAQQIDRPYHKARVLTAIAQTYGQLKNFTEAGKYYGQAITAAQQIDDSNYLDDKARVLIAIVETMGQLKNFTEAGKYLGLAITAAQQIDEPYYKARVLIAIAKTYGQLKNFTAADKYLTQAITATLQIHEPDPKLMLLVELAKTMGQLKNFTAANKYLTQAITATLQIYEPFYEPYYKVKVLTAIAQTYSQLKNFSEAGKYYGQAITAAQQIDDSNYLDDKAEVLTAIAKTYGQLENFTAASQYLTQAITAAEQIDRSSHKARVLPAIIKIQVEEHDRWQQVHPTGWRKAHNTVSKCPGKDCRVESLAHILTAWAEKKNPALK